MRTERREARAEPPVFVLQYCGFVGSSARADDGQLRQRRPHRAVVARGLRGVEPALQHQAVSRSRADVGRDGIRFLCLPAVGVRQRHEVVDRRRCDARVDVVERSWNRISAAVRQARVDRRGNRERVEVRRLQRQVVGDDEVFEPAPVVADVERHARQQLLLHGGANLPVARSHAPPGEQRWDPASCRRTDFPKFVLATAPQTSPPAARRSCAALFRRSQSAVQLRLATVHVRVAVVETRDVGRLATNSPAFCAASR